MNVTDRLTFVSDGVIEAHNAAGDMYGFDRTRQLAANRLASEIAQTVCAFGQEDDITVITIERSPEAACAA